MLEIRKMNIEDFDQIKKSLETDFDNFWSPSVLEMSLKYEDAFYLVAILDNEIVGFAGYRVILDTADIENIVVKKSFRNKHIGTKLFEALIESIENSKIKIINLEVNQENNVAIKLYKNFGFKEQGIRKNYYKNHTNALLMQKKL